MIEVVGKVEQAKLTEIEGFVRSHRTLEDVTRWALACRPQKAIVDLVTQDEYTHDVVVRYAGQAYLVYDTT
jgi:hypothetical protein